MMPPKADFFQQLIELKHLVQATNDKISISVVNWHFTKEIRNKIINLNKTKRLENIFCNQIFSKELTLRRNNALEITYKQTKTCK